jgi:hypothetical protein
MRCALAHQVLCEALVDPLVVVAAEVLEEEVRFGAQLHVTVLDAVVHHLGVMTAPTVTDPIAARGSRFGFFGANALENVSHMGPGLGAAKA